MRSNKTMQVRDNITTRLSSKTFVFSLLAVALLIIFSVGVEGANCGAIPTQGCTVPAGTLTFSRGTYYLNSTLGYVGGIVIAASNVYLDGNGSTLINNNSNLGSCISNTASTRYNNVTIINFNCQGYKTGFDSITNNSYFLNSNISNSSVGIYLEGVPTVAYSHDNTIAGVKIFGTNTTTRNFTDRTDGRWQDIYVKNNLNTLIENCTLNNGTTGINLYLSNNSIVRYNIFRDGYESITLDSSYNVTVKYNDIIGRRVNAWYGYGQLVPLLYTVGIVSISENKDIIANNNISWVVIGTRHITNSSNTLYENNSIIEIDRGISIGDGSTNVNISKNTILNASLNSDFYSNAIAIISITTEATPTNIRIINNTLDYGAAGLNLWRVNQISVINNSFIQHNVENRSTVGRCTDTVTAGNCDRGEPPCAIRVSEIYKTWDATLGAETNVRNLTGYFYKMRSDNITISGNTYSGNTQCYFYNQGASNVSFDFTNYWYTKLQFPNINGDYLTDPDEYYVPNNVSQLYQKDDSYTNILYKQYTGTYYRWAVNYTISKNNISFMWDNRNSTENYIISLLTLPTTTGSYHITNNTVNKGYLINSLLPYNFTLGSGTNWELDNVTCVVPTEDSSLNFSRGSYYCQPNSYFDYNITASKIEVRAIIQTNMNFTELSSPYNDIYNATNGRVIAYDVSEWTGTLNAGDQIEVTYCGRDDACSGNIDLDYYNVTIADDCSVTADNLPADLLYSIAYKYDTESAAYNSTEYSMSGINTLASWNPTWAVIISAAVVIGLIGAYFAFVRRD